MNLFIHKIEQIHPLFFLFEKLNLHCTKTREREQTKIGNWNFEKVESTTESTGKLIFRFVVRRQDVQYFAINPSVVIYTYAKNYQLAIVIVRHVKGIKEIPCIRSFQTIPIRFAELSHACAFTIRARVSRCSLLAMSMAYPLACY